MSNTRSCKPGFNSCNIGADDYKAHQAAEAKAAREAAASDNNSEAKACKPGFSSCSVGGAYRSATPENTRKGPDGCKQGFSSCNI